jgi:hypothetical protein
MERMQYHTALSFLSLPASHALMSSGPIMTPGTTDLIFKRVNIYPGPG